MGIFWTSANAWPRRWEFKIPLPSSVFQSHDVVRQEMRKARAFVQHSITASNGDSEGTPVAVLEAGAIGLPVVATRHAGISDVVSHGETGLLVAERDIAGMAACMLELARNPSLAAGLGRNAAAQVRQHYTMEQSIRRLTRILDAAVHGHSLDTLRETVEFEFPGASLRDDTCKSDQEPRPEPPFSDAQRSSVLRVMQRVIEQTPYRHLMGDICEPT